MPPRSQLKKLRIPPSKAEIKLAKRRETGDWRNVTEFKVHRRRRVDFPPPTPQPSPCVLWQGRVDKYGYGVITHQGEHKGRLSPKVHRFIMELAIGRPLDPKEFVLHACDNRPCYSLLHLSIGTVQDNNRDMVQKKRNKRPPPNVFHGAEHPMAKLTENDVLRIHQLAREGVTQGRIAQLVGISRPTVNQIINRKRWATLDVGEPPSSVPNPSTEEES